MVLGKTSIDVAKYPKPMLQGKFDETIWSGVVRCFGLRKLKVGRGGLEHPVRPSRPRSALSELPKDM